MSETCPEDATTLWGWMTFGFVEPLIQLAGKRTLTEADVWQLSPFFQHRNIFQKFLISPMLVISLSHHAMNFHVSDFDG